MRAIAFSFFSISTLAIFLSASSVQAADCRNCAKYPSVAACISCVQKYHGKARFTAGQMGDWCKTNQPLCYQPKKK